MITFDFDEISWNELKQKLELLRHFYPSEDIYFRKSCQKGWHVKIPALENDFDLRFSLGDDRKRIEIDKLRERAGLPINVLFDKKILQYGVEVKAGEWKQWK